VAELHDEYFKSGRDSQYDPSSAVPKGRRVDKWNVKMAGGKIIIDIERCKGCGLCISVCPKNGIVISNCSNKAGYFPAQPVNESDCTGCAMCAIVCPEAGIEVYREDDGTIEINTKPSKEKLQPQSCAGGNLKK